MFARMFFLAIAAALVFMINAATASVTVTAIGPHQPMVIPTENADRDKTWTTGGAKNEAGSQTVMSQALASRVSFQAEGMGLERIP